MNLRLITCRDGTCACRLPWRGFSLPDGVNLPNLYHYLSANKDNCTIMAKSRSKTGNNKVARTQGAAGGWAGLVMVDPRRIRYQHARIRPIFSGCGRRLTETLQSIRDEKMKPEDLPPIQVIGGPLVEDGAERWYFSLNNRRLWVLKQCREEGLLSNNQIQVRIRQPKSAAEKERFTVEKCALEAKILRDPASFKGQQKQMKGGEAADKLANNSCKKDECTEMSNQVKINAENGGEENSNEDMSVGSDDNESDSDDEVAPCVNPFSALM